MSKEQATYQNKGGRNKLDTDELKRNYNIMLSKNDLRKLRKKFTKNKGINISLAEYLRAILLKKEVKFLYYEKGKIEIIRELSTIGNNINQIAKHINQKGIDSINEKMYEKKTIK